MYIASVQSIIYFRCVNIGKYIRLKFKRVNIQNIAT